MNFDNIIFDLSVIFVGIAILGTLFLYMKQPIIIAYIVIGFALGPNGFSLFPDVNHIEEIAHFGIILLLFLIGLNLQPMKLVRLFRKTSLLTLLTSIFFAGVSFLFALLIGFDMISSLLFGVAMMFSSTVVGLKLIPSSSLYQKRTGEVMTGVLLLQDVLAIIVILFIVGEKSSHIAITFAMLIGKFVLISLLSFIGVRFIMKRLLRRFEIVQEYTFIATLGWCLLWAEVAHIFGLSYEMGAFIAGLSIASSPIAVAIADHLKPLREFFLILFFFAVGAKLNIQLAPHFLVGSIIFGALLVPLKAFIFYFAFQKNGESKKLSKEVAVRLAQSSEFSLLVVFAAMSVDLLTNEQGMAIQIATIVTFIVSTYWVVFKYPTTISAGSTKITKK